MNPSQQIQWLLIIALLAPLASSVLSLLLTKQLLFKSVGWITTAVMAGAFVACAMASFLWINHDLSDVIVWNIPWIPLPGTQVGWLHLGIMADSLTILMMTMVTLISTLVHLYSIGYMAGDSRYNRFFAYLSLFSFAMLGIVAANSLLMLLVFWELVGLTSYLLIGFWFEKPGPQQASKKAFVMNRIGDTGFVIGIGILFYQLGGKMLLPATGQEGNIFAGVLQVIEAQGHTITDPPLWLTAAGVCLFFGAIGKSAQFPLHTWLPDAMEGPTPVSSIVHSATMVAAGVYLTARLYPILTPGVHLFIAGIGLITLTIGACMALVSTDIKRVLAYSTMSQLGYMMLGLGAGAWVFAIYHLVTHAFFKCCLFQAAGSVIHGCHHQQDMRHYGGLWRKMPITAICYFICTLAIAGASIPMTAWGISGYYSKDGILAGAYNYAWALEALGPWAWVFWVVPMAVAYITVFYMARSFTLTFLGSPRDAHLYEHAHEAPGPMLVSQVVLAVLAVAAAPALVLRPLVDAMPRVSYIQPDVLAADVSGPLSYRQIEQIMHDGFHSTHLYLGYGLGWLVMLIAGSALYWGGTAFTHRLVKLPILKQIHELFVSKFYFDALYDTLITGACKLAAVACSSFDRYIVDGLVNGAAWAMGRVAAAAGLIDHNRPMAWRDTNFDAPASAATSETMRTGRLRVYVVTMFVVGLLSMALVLAMFLHSATGGNH